MGALIDDLLRLSRVGRSDLEAATVDLAGPCREFFAELASGSPDRIARRHGGTVHAEGREDQGATLHVLLPAAPGSQG
jgi:signal transduction histidine kinase